MLTKGNVKLRPFEEKDVGLYYDWINREESMGVYGGFGIMSKDEVMKLFREGFFWSENRKYLIIEVDNKPVGEVVIHRAFNYHSASLELAICIEEQKYRKMGAGTKSIKLLLDYIFNYSPEVNRIHAIIDVANEPSIKLFSACNFKREGILRGILFHHGECKDSCVYSIIRSEWKNIP